MGSASEPEASAIRGTGASAASGAGEPGRRELPPWHIPEIVVHINDLWFHNPKETPLFSRTGIDPDMVEVRRNPPPPRSVYYGCPTPKGEPESFGPYDYRAGPREGPRNVEEAWQLAVTRLPRAHRRSSPLIRDRHTMHRELRKS